jgi:hypothetical protein
LKRVNVLNIKRQHTDFKSHKIKEFLRGCPGWERTRDLLIFIYCRIFY